MLPFVLRNTIGLEKKNKKAETLQPNQVNKKIYIKRNIIISAKPQFI